MTKVHMPGFGTSARWVSATAGVHHDVKKVAASSAGGSMLVDQLGEYL